MSKRASHIPYITKWTAFHTASWCALLLFAAQGKAQPMAPEEVTKAISQVESGDFSLFAVEEIAEAHAVQAIPILEKQFAVDSDEISKAKLASALVTLGDKNDAYWNFLLGEATEAVNSDAPLPAMYDPKGTLVRGQMSPVFKAWAKAHNVSLESAVESATYKLPGDVAFLAETGDPRAVPLLRQALQSPNFLIATMAAKGLALIQDKASISLIIQACKRAHPDEAIPIADSLIYFDDPLAQSAADQYLPKDYAQVARDARAHGQGPFHHQ